MKVGLSHILIIVVCFVSSNLCFSKSHALSDIYKTIATGQLNKGDTRLTVTVIDLVKLKKVENSIDFNLKKE